MKFQLEDGKIKIDVLKNLLKTIPDDEISNAMSQSIDKCSDVSGSDECEVAGNFIKCMAEAKKSLE